MIRHPALRHRQQDWRDGAMTAAAQSSLVAERTTGLGARRSRLEQHFQLSLDSIQALFNKCEALLNGHEALLEPLLQ